MGGFKCKDLDPSLSQAISALNAAKKEFKEKRYERNGGETQEVTE